MSETDKVFTGSIAENYDRYLVPLIFEKFAADIAQRAAALSPGTVLETAAGSGVVARALAPRLSPNARYVVTDLNQPMLDYAATRQGVDSRISWRQADALALPFENAAFDLVCCQFGAMFFPDRPSGYREAKRVLKLGGHFLFTERSSPLPGKNASWLSRHRADPWRAGTGGLLQRHDRNESGAEPRIVAPSSRRRLLPGNPATQRDRGQRCRKAGGSDRPRCIRHRKPTRKRRGCRQNSGARNRG